MSHVPSWDESCDNTSHVTLINDSYTYTECVLHVWRMGIMSNVWMSHVTHIWMSHITYINTSWWLHNVGWTGAHTHTHNTHIHTHTLSLSLTHTHTHTHNLTHTYLLSLLFFFFSCIYNSVQPQCLRVYAEGAGGRGGEWGGLAAALARQRTRVLDRGYTPKNKASCYTYPALYMCMTHS